MKHWNAEDIRHGLVDPRMVLKPRQNLAHDRDRNPRPARTVDRPLQRFPISGKKLRIGRPAARPVVSISANKILLPRLEVAEARHVAPTANESTGGLSIARLGHDGLHALRDVELVLQIMPQHPARVGDTGVQQDARTLETRSAQHHHRGLHVQFAPRMPVDEMRAAREPGVPVERDLAHHRVGHDCQIAGRHRIGQQQVERTGELPASQGSPHLRIHNAACGGRGDEALVDFALRRRVLNETRRRAAEASPLFCPTRERSARPGRSTARDRHSSAASFRQTRRGLSP